MFRFKRYFTKIKNTLKDLLRQGMSPPKLALALALGAAVGTFPIIGTNTALLVLLCLLFRLNFVAPQITNYAVYPLQIFMLLPFFNLGAFLLGSELTIDLDEMMYLFRHHWWQALQQFGRAIFAAIVGWVVLVVPFFACCYFLFLGILLKMKKTGNA